MTLVHTPHFGQFMVLSLQQSRICRLRLAHLPARWEIRKKPESWLQFLSRAQYDQTRHLRLFSKYKSPHI